MAIATQETKRDLTPFEAALMRTKRSVETLTGSREAADALVVLVLNQARRVPALFRCTSESIMDAVVRIARLHLDPAIPNEVWLVPFGTEATLIFGYGGLRKLVLRSPDVQDVFTQVVCQNDAYHPAANQVELPIHRLPEGFKPRGRAIGYYAAAYLRSGHWRVVSMSRAEAEGHRDRYSKAAKSDFWADNRADKEGLTNFDKMAMKSCLRMLCSPRMLTLDADITAALASEERLYQETPAQTQGYERDGNRTPPLPTGAVDTMADLLNDLAGDQAAVATQLQAARKGKADNPPIDVDPNTGEIVEHGHMETSTSLSSNPPAWRETLEAHKDDSRLPKDLAAKVRLALNPKSETNDTKGLELASAVLDWCVPDSDKKPVA